MDKLRSYSWKGIRVDLGEKVEELLLDYGWTREGDKSPIELWRMRSNGFTFIFYKSGTLYVSYPESREEEFKRVRELINYYIGKRYTAPSKEFLIGVDEVGKGEVIGSIILAGVSFSKELFDGLDIMIDNIDTKRNHRMEYWEEICSNYPS